MNVYKEVTANGVRLQLVYDDNGCDANPRDNCGNLGLIVTKHKRYHLGDFEAKNTDHYSSWEDWLAGEQPRDTIALPVYLYDHSGLRISTVPFNDNWDSGQLGYILTTPKRIRAVMGWKRISAKRWKEVEPMLIDEIRIYDTYLSGEIFGVIRTDTETGTEIDACWGYVGIDAVLANLDEPLARALKEAL